MGGHRRPGGCPLTEHLPSLSWHVLGSFLALELVEYFTVGKSLLKQYSDQEQIESQVFNDPAATQTAILTQHQPSTDISVAQPLTSIVQTFP